MALSDTIPSDSAISGAMNPGCGVVAIVVALRLFPTFCQAFMRQAPALIIQQRYLINETESCLTISGDTYEG